MVWPEHQARHYLMTSNLRMAAGTALYHQVNYELFAWEERAGHNYGLDDNGH